MLGTSVQLGRRLGDDRFYDAAKARRGQQNPMSSRGSGGGAAAVSTAPAKEKAAVAEDSSLQPSTGISNLERFLMSINPSVPAQNLSKRTMRGRRTCDVEFRPYFILGDLWESFKEWSAYGAGVPLVLNGSDSVVQYYVPYLSGIQLYGEASRQAASSSRRAGEDSDGDSCHDSSSDGSSDYEHERGLKFCRDWNQSHLTNSSTLRIDRLSLNEEHVSSQEGFSSDESESGNSRGCLLFEYLELDPPYCREPLADKISNLASRFPDLRTSRSCDLLPTSWISVAWYPIYRIPTGPTLKDLDACFLTFHSLSTQKRGGSASGVIATYPRGIDAAPMVSLPAFGLASYKFKEAMWSSSGGNEMQLASTLLQAADNWLQHLRVGHPDYQFFVSHGAFRR
ncbi:uncharacterized protein [Typha latifolia]|uniref:uncharacterized protein n=1 Tax=Typha latifolia TaxID=4733 RepID=UPI003C2B653A